MIELYFEPNEREIDRAVNGNAAAQPQIILQTGYFIMPVSFIVDGHNLLSIRRETGNDLTIDLEIIDVAISLTQAVETAWSSGEALWEPDETGSFMRLQRIDGEIEIYSPLSNVSVRADYEHLINVCHRFGDEVRRFILPALPDVRNHPELGPWFRGEPVDWER